MPRPRCWRPPRRSARHPAAAPWSCCAGGSSTGARVDRTGTETPADAVRRSRPGGPGFAAPRTGRAMCRGRPPSRRPWPSPPHGPECRSRAPDRPPPPRRARPAPRQSAGPALRPRTTPAGIPPLQCGDRPPEARHRPAGSACARRPSKLELVERSEHVGGCHRLRLLHFPPLPGFMLRPAASLPSAPRFHAPPRCFIRLTLIRARDLHGRVLRAGSR